MKSELIRQLRGDEGCKATVYKDSLGYWTIGVGRLVDPSKPGAGLRSSEIDFMLNNDVDDRINALHKVLPWFQDLDDARKGVLLNMSFQLGVEGLLGFTNTLKAVKDGRYADASWPLWFLPQAPSANTATKPMTKSSVLAWKKPPTKAPIRWLEWA